MYDVIMGSIAEKLNVIIVHVILQLFRATRNKIKRNKQTNIMRNMKIPLK